MVVICKVSQFGCDVLNFEAVILLSDRSFPTWQLRHTAPVGNSPQVKNHCLIETPPFRARCGYSSDICCSLHQGGATAKLTLQMPHQGFRKDNAGGNLALWQSDLASLHKILHGIDICNSTFQGLVA